MKLTEKLSRLAEVQQTLSDLSAEAKMLESEAVAEMAESSLSELKVNDYKFMLKARRPSRNMEAQPCAEVLELRSAVQAERDEMADANKHELYKLQQTVRLAELRQAQLLTNDFIAEMQKKLAEAELRGAKQSQGTAGQVQYALQMQKVASKAEHAEASKWIGRARDEHQSDCADVEPLTFRQITTWLKNTGLQLPGDEQKVNALWQMRRSQHIDFWQRRGKCFGEQVRPAEQAE